MNRLLIGIIMGIILILAISSFYYFYRKDEFKNSKHKNRLVLYYTPWCGHCAMLKPEWVEFQKNNKLKDMEVEMVDCDTSQEICNKFKIETIPTIIFHKENEEITYEGAKEIDQIKDWVKTILPQ